MMASRICAIAGLLPLIVWSAEPLRLEREIPMPGVEGRIDHLAADVKGNRIFVAALGNNTVEVLDLAAGKRAHSITGLHEPQGILYLPEPNRIFVANGGDGKLKIFDGVSLAPVGEADFSGDADNVRYDARAKHVYVGYASGALGVVDVKSGRKIGNVELAGHPESFQLEKSGSRIFVNVPTAQHLAVVDRGSLSVKDKWPMGGDRANFPMALDEPGGRLFVGCRKPAEVRVFDTGSGKIAAAFSCVGDTDDLFWDAALKRLYVTGGEGFVDVYGRRDSDHYERIARIPTGAGARTSLFVPEQKRLYVAVPHRGAQGAKILVYAREP
jgi:DNA-binding beta-propeller fold protein YncE